MKKIILIAAIVMAAISVKAQDPVGTISLKPMAGFTASSLSNQDIHYTVLSEEGTVNSSMKAGFIGGLEAEYQATKIFGVSVGLLYSMQGCTWENFSVGDANGTTWTTVTKDASANLGYINIPILAKVYVIKGLAVKAGVQPGFLVSAKSKNDGKSNDFKSDCKTFDFSIPVGASYEFSKFVIDARYNFGLTKVNKEGDDSKKNGVIQITLGYKFAL